VGTDLSLDVQRNPAVLPLAVSGHAWGVFAIGKALYEDSTDATLNATNIEYNNTKNIEANLLASYVRNYGDFSWGLALGNVGSGQFAMTRDEMKIIGFDNTSENTTINPSLTFAFGIRLTGTDYAGVKVRAGYSYNEKTEDKTGGTPQTTNQTTNSSSYLMTVGYLKRFGATQIGAMVDSGTFLIEQTEAENEYGSNARSDSGDVQYNYITGPSFTAGAYNSMNRFFSIALEVKFTIPVFFHRDDYIFSDISSTITTSSGRYAMRPMVTVNGGVEFRPTPRWALNLGGGVINQAATSYYREGGIDRTNRQTIMVAVATAGVDYYFSRTTALVTGIIYTYVNADLATNYYTVNKRVKIESEAHGIDVFVGFNYGW